MKKITIPTCYDVVFCGGGPAGLSAAICDAVAFGALRVIPNCMAMGEAAGRAAALALDSKVDAAQIDIDKLRTILLKNSAIL